MNPIIDALLAPIEDCLSQVRHVRYAVLELPVQVGPRGASKSLQKCYAEVMDAAGLCRDDLLNFRRAVLVWAACCGLAATSDLLSDPQAPTADDTSA